MVDFMRWRSRSKIARPGRIIAERYRLVGSLSRGAMGEIWRAEHLLLKSEVAIKFLDESIADDPEMLERFLREAQSAAAVRSTHVVQIFDCGVAGGTPYIAMELLQGESLDARLNARGRLTPAELDEIFGAVAVAIGNAHNIGVIHRDLKPGNIFIAREGELEITKVLDFGIAKVMSQTLSLGSGLGTRTGTLLGTPNYMSPEQARGSRDLDQSTDLWSLAIIAFECLTGQQPFAGETIGDVVVQICTEAPRVPSSLADVPAGFDEWFLKGASKKPSERFGSASEMAETLSAVLQGAALPESDVGELWTEPTLHSITLPPVPRERPASDAAASSRGSPASASSLLLLDSVRDPASADSVSSTTAALRASALPRRMRRTLAPVVAGRQPRERWARSLSLSLVGGGGLIVLWYATSNPTPALLDAETRAAAVRPSAEEVFELQPPSLTSAPPAAAAAGLTPVLSPATGDAPGEREPSPAASPDAPRVPPPAVPLPAVPPARAALPPRPNAEGSRERSPLAPAASPPAASLPAASLPAASLPAISSPARTHARTAPEPPPASAVSPAVSPPRSRPPEKTTPDPFAERL